MKDSAFIFPGQGSQVVGMGKDLFEKTEFGKKIFKLADDILYYPLSKICFEGPEEELKLTYNTQPALLTVSYILFQLLEKSPIIAAGHSLGEYSALLCAGALSFEEAVLLVHKRGKYMQDAVPVGKGTMAAVMGADYDKVAEIISTIQGIVNIANWNSATQIVLSGEKDAVQEAVEKLAAPKSVFLPVSAPFHSQLMLAAEQKLSIDLDQITFKNPVFPIVNNVWAKEMSKGEEAREALKKQVTRPVLWHKTMLMFLEEKGITKFQEIGSSKVLTGILKRTAREIGKDVELINIQSYEDVI